MTYTQVIRHPQKKAVQLMIYSGSELGGGRAMRLRRRMKVQNREGTVAEIAQLSNTLTFGGAVGGDISDETAASPAPPLTVILFLDFSSEGQERSAAPSPPSSRMRPLAR
jgi:hypothetical protein